jgi:3',5'-cyclic AMP phosphodiesterase CpdA
MPKHPTRHNKAARLSIAIISDLHCHKEKTNPDSYFIAGSLRRSRGRHPVQDLLDLIKVHKLQADALLVGGDLANQADQEGLSQAWESVLEIGRELQCASVIPVLGNHDVESRRAEGGTDRDPSYMARNLRPGFPFPRDEDCASFFSDGFCVLSLSDQAQLVAINTVIGHLDAKSAVSGTFDMARIDAMKESLQRKLSAPIRIAMMHHHPVLHSGPFVPDRDVLPTGDAILSALKASGCRFVIHGHKHLARLRKVDALTVLAAGSFSAIGNEYGKAMGNMFHLADLECTAPTGTELRGSLKTWTYHLGTGWVTSQYKYCGFPFHTGFGAKRSPEELVSAISDFVSARNLKSVVDEKEVLHAVPDVQFVTPEEFKSLSSRLMDLKLKFYDYDDGHFHLGKII